MNEVSNSNTIRDYFDLLADQMTEKLVEMNPDKETDRQSLIESLMEIVNQSEVSSEQMQTFKIEEASEMINETIDHYFEDLDSHIQ